MKKLVGFNQLSCKYWTGYSPVLEVVLSTLATKPSSCKGRQGSLLRIPGVGVRWGQQLNKFDPACDLVVMPNNFAASALISHPSFLEQTAIVLSKRNGLFFGSRNLA